MVYYSDGGAKKTEGGEKRPALRHMPGREPYIPNMIGGEFYRAVVSLAETLTVTAPFVAV